MEYPNRLKENHNNLSKKMDALKKFMDEKASKKADHMAHWLGKVNRIIREFDGLERRIARLSYRDNIWARRDRNVEVLEMLRIVNDLTEQGNELSNTIDALFDNLMEGKPKRFSHANLISFTSNFSKGSIPARHGTVYKGKFPNKEEVGVKMLESSEEAVEAIFISQINTMFKTSHRNLVKLHGFCFEENSKALVFEYMENGPLDKVLFENHHDIIEWDKLYNIAIEIGKGLSYLHDGCDEQLIHRDLSTGNVHLDSSFSPKITNFGMMKLMKRPQNHFNMSRTQDLSYYAAPELRVRSSEVTYKCDVYSFGMILFEVFGRRENQEENINFPKQVYWKKFEEGRFEELRAEYGIPDDNRMEAKILCMVAFWCIQRTPENRPSMSTVVKMLEKEIQVVSPPNPFVAATSIMKSYKEVVYED